MKTLYQYLSIFSVMASLCVTGGCKKKNGNVWDDSRTSGNYKTKGSLWGDDEALAADKDNLFGPADEDFIPLKDEDLKMQFADQAVPQSRFEPGEEGSGVPGIDQFRIPTSVLAGIFRNVFFSTDDHILRGQEALAVIDKVANYLTKHPETDVFIEGHCDERGPEAYNLALGARRANYIRTLLVQKGVSQDQLHTISYGKEQPLEQGHTAQAWSKNRRAQFKIHQR